jgi:hypothetical protein
MTLFPIYDENNFGDLVVTGGVWIPREIKTMLFQEDVEQALDRMDLSTDLYKEAMSGWICYRQGLLIKEIKEDSDNMPDHHHRDGVRFKKGQRRATVLKRGWNRMLRHRQFEQRKKRRVYIVENV